MTFAVVVEPLSSTHERASFTSGVPALDRYIREQAGQDVRRRVGNCFVAVEQETRAIVGYYTLAASSVPVTELPLTETKRLPRYPVLPATLIGRLAVDSSYRGRQLGIALVADAIRRSARAEPAVFTLLVDAKDDAAAAFYHKLGFVPLASRSLTLFLPIATALKLFA
ncbi:MAG: GNAT family N-acetyltransferase [Xanthobacteraceae bacterium]